MPCGSSPLPLLTQFFRKTTNCIGSRCGWFRDLGTRKAGQLLAQFRTPQAIFRASRSDLESNGLSGSVAQTIASGCTFEDAVDQQQKMLETGALLIPISDPRYPATAQGDFRSSDRAFRPRDGWSCCIPSCWAWWGRGGLRPTGSRPPSGCRPIWRRLGSPSSVEWREGSTRPRIAARSKSAATRSRFSAAAWTWFTRPRIAS